MTLIASAALAAPLPALDESRFLAAIAQVEGHKWSDPGGAYGIQPSVWRDRSKLPYRYASHASAAGIVARRHLAWLSRSLRADGYEVTPYALAGCWRWGFEGFKARHALGPIDYATRVQNLFDCRDSIVTTTQKHE